MTRLPNHLPPLDTVSSPGSGDKQDDICLDIGPPLVKTDSGTCSQGHDAIVKKQAVCIDADVDVVDVIRADGGDENDGADTVDVETSKSPTARQIFYGIGSACVKGLAFGFALEKGRVFEPRVIVAQMRFEQWLMLKMFLSAVTISLIVLALLSVVPATKRYFQRSRDAFGYTRGWPVVAMGAFILGCGMTVAGACPGTVLAQIGAGIPYAGLIYAGGLVATFSYAVLEQRLFAPMWLHGKIPADKDTLDKLIKKPFWAVGLTFAAVLIGILVILEHFAPWKSDYVFPERVADPTSGSVFTRYAWPPIAAGAVIGLNQLPAVLLVGDTIGSASSYATIVSNAAHLLAPKWASGVPHLAQARSGLGNWWQVAYVCCAVLGALGSALLSGTHGLAEGVTPARSFAGGFLILFGSRIAAGCTSGHGISGMGLMVLVSFVAIPSMFAGGIVVALWSAM